MEFLGIGWGELLLILIVALIIWGPGRIIEVGRTLGKTLRSFRKAVSDVTAQAGREFEAEKRSLPPEKQRETFFK